MFNKKKIKKICILTPSFNGGGAQKIALNLANYYSKNHQVDLIALKSSGPFKKEVNKKVNLIILNRRSRDSFFRLVKVLKRSKSDVVISVIRDTNILLGLSSFFFKSKIIFREASTLDKVLHFNKIKRFLYLKLMNLTYRRASKIIANSFDTKRDLIKFKVIDSNECVVIGNPVLPENINNLIKENILDQWFYNSNFKLILNVGRLSKEKNQIFLLKAFAFAFKLDQSIRLIIVGEGEEKDNLINASIKLGVREYFKIIPFTPNPFPFYHKSDIFVLTSLFEGFGNVIVEAMACKTPVICLDCSGGPKMILKNGLYGKLVQKDIASEELGNLIVKELKVKNNDQICEAEKRALEYSVKVKADSYLQF